MNFYEKEMRFMFDPFDGIEDKKYVGRTMLGRLDNDKLLKLQFISTTVKDKYDAIHLSVINRNEGVIDSQTIRFSDVIGMYNRGNGFSEIEPHMWEYNGKPEWYTPLSNNQKNEIADMVYGYVQMYFDHSHILEMQFR